MPEYNIHRSGKRQIPVIENAVTQVWPTYIAEARAIQESLRGKINAHDRFGKIRAGRLLPESARRAHRLVSAV